MYAIIPAIVSFIVVYSRRFFFAFTSEVAILTLLSFLSLFHCFLFLMSYNSQVLLILMISQTVLIITPFKALCLAMPYPVTPTRPICIYLLLSTHSRVHLNKPSYWTTTLSLLSSIAFVQQCQCKCQSAVQSLLWTDIRILTAHFRYWAEQRARRWAVRS